MFYSLGNPRWIEAEIRRGGHSLEGYAGRVQAS